MVVVIIIGILAAIALPSFLNQANKARQSEAKTYVGSVNRAQQAFYLEERDFAETLEELQIGIPEVTDNYEYAIGATDIDSTLFQATPAGGATDLLAYSGGVWIGTTENGTATTEAELCETDAPSAAPPDTCGEA